MENKVLILVGVLALAITLTAQTIVFATHEATQNASTNKATTITVVGQDYTTEVTTITFTAGAPSAVISNPSNGTTSQVFGAAGTAKPVVALLNSSGGTLKIYYTILAFSNDVAASEKYLINAKAAACENVAAITESVVFDTLTDSAIQISDGIDNAKDLYLSLTLSSLAGKTGSSAITILGETP